MISMQSEEGQGLWQRLRGTIRGREADCGEEMMTSG